MTTPADDQGAVRLTRNGAVAHLIFDRPQARNAMTWTMYQGLADACDEIMDDPSVRVAVFRGAGGKAFVAGTDIAQFGAFTSGDDGLAYEDKVETYISRVERLPMPTLCVVEGWA
ncbi:MAG: enoyl-CoA hydratase-related protein, partial [Rhodospirillales bacterium]